MKLFESYNRAALIACVVVTSCVFNAYGQVWSTVSSAAAIGSAVQLNCSFPGRPTTGIAQLKFFNTSVLSTSYTFYYSVSPGATPTEYYPELFTVEENPTTYDEFGVTVLSLSRTTSTAYECTNVINSVQAFITGLEPVVCPTVAGEPVPEGTSVVLNCSVTFYKFPEDTSHPKLEWTDENGIIENQSTETHGNTLSATVNLTLQAEHDGMPMNCVVSYDDASIYNDSCETVYLVTHGVSIVNSSIAMNTEVFVGDVINCTSNGRPAPTISWFTLEGAVASDDFQLTITEEMVSEEPVTYTCIATNSVEGHEFTKDLNVTFIASSDRPAIVASAGVEPWVIAVAVVVPVVVITALVIGGYFFYRHRKGKKDAKKKSTSNGTNTAAYSAAPTSDPTPYSSSVRSANGNAPAPYAAPRSTPPPTGGAPGRISPGGHGDLGVRYYTGSNQNLDSTAPSPVPPQPSRPAYPYNPRNGTTNAAPVNMNPNPGSRYAPAGPPPGNPSGYPYSGGPQPVRQPSVASTSSRSSYQASPLPPPVVTLNQRSGHGSLAGSEV